MDLFINLWSINLSGRHANYSHGAIQRSLLSHVFAAFGVVCGENTKDNFFVKHVS